MRNRRIAIALGAVIVVAVVGFGGPALVNAASSGSSTGTQTVTPGTAWAKVGSCTSLQAITAATTGYSGWDRVQVRMPSSAGFVTAPSVTLPAGSALGGCGGKLTATFRYCSAAHDKQRADKERNECPPGRRTDVSKSINISTAVIGGTAAPSGVTVQCAPGETTGRLATTITLTAAFHAPGVVSSATVSGTAKGSTGLTTSAPSTSVPAGTLGFPCHGKATYTFTAPPASGYATSASVAISRTDCPSGTHCS